MQRAILGLWIILAVSTGRCPGQEACPVEIESPPCVTAPPAVSDVRCPDGVRLWGGVDYLLWWIRPGNVPPLVVTGSAADPFPGALDQPGTRILLGGSLDYGTFNGLRLHLGGWLDRDRVIGIEASGFVLEQRAVQFQAAGDANGQPFLAAPFVNALTGNQNVYFIAQNFADPTRSAFQTGAVGMASTTRLSSWEANFVANLADTDSFSADAFAGFRTLSLCEDLNFNTTASNLIAGGASLFLLNPIDPRFSVTTLDRFTTTNRFYGGQLGARVKLGLDMFTLGLVGKLALGSMRESVTIDGATTTTAPLPVAQAVGGIYSQASNIGSFSRDVFSVIPEAGVNVGVRITDNIQAHVGYTILYLSSVVRPGDQIDPRININRVAIDGAFGTPGGPNLPAFDWRATCFWAQGINFGVEVTY